MVETQQQDIRNIARCARFCQKYEWAARAPFRAVQRTLLGNHVILPRADYYGEVLALLGRTPRQPLSRYRDELTHNEPLRRTYMDAVNQGKQKWKYQRYEDRFDNEANLVNYYAVIRELAPQVVVETGTAAGSMTSWVLAALEENGQGQLISIDIPPVEGKWTMDTTISKEAIGFLIPREFHSRWDYRCGDAKILLPKVLVDHSVDVFIHDSLHTRTHMLFEYNVARCLMRPDTLIMSDDILWNSAFFDFLKAHRLQGLGCVTNPNLGLSVNRFDAYELDIGTGLIRPTDEAATAATR